MECVFDMERQMLLTETIMRLKHKRECIDRFSYDNLRSFIFSYCNWNDDMHMWMQVFVCYTYLNIIDNELINVCNIILIIMWIICLYLF